MSKVKTTSRLLHVLIVEDDRCERTMLHEALTGMGFRASTAASGREGLIMAMHEGPDVVVCDCALPELSGLEMIEQLRRFSRCEQTAVIMLTSVGHMLKPSQLADTGVRCILSKPCSVRELAAQIFEVLGHPGFGVVGNAFVERAA